jgi:hypothetical protein
MKKNKSISTVLLGIFFLSLTCPVYAESSDLPYAWWKFDDIEQTKFSEDFITQSQDILTGYVKYTKGVSGSALVFDGYTTSVVRQSSKAPQLSDSFSFEAWIAVQAYPWALCAIVNQCQQPDLKPTTKIGERQPEEDPTAGYVFGIDANGRLHLQLSVDGKWQKCTSEEKIPLMKWTHIAGTFDSSNGITVYINGKKAAEKDISGKLKLASEVNLIVGRINKVRIPEYALNTSTPAMYSFDGYIDEVKIHGGVLTSEQISKCFSSVKPPEQTGQKFRRLPDEPKGPAPFGAYYTNLKFDDAWDAVRHEGPMSDVVVLFDDKPWRFVHWRGTGYVPHWVTENDIWYSNEFNETWGDGEYVAEPMSDKQCRYSNVRIIESSDARVVLHWRYALCDIIYNLVRTDPYSNWNDWADEYNYIYPDGVGIRKQVLWSSEISEPHEFHESMILSQPGTKPEDNIHTDALTLVNMQGESHTYSWLPQVSRQLDKPDSRNIQIVNTKSKAKPFLIVSDKPFKQKTDPVMTMIRNMSDEEREKLTEKYNAASPEEKQKMGVELYLQAMQMGIKEETEFPGPVFFPYSMFINKENSIFPWWNHWPVAQIPSDGRNATSPDRVAHTSVSNVWAWENYELTENRQTRIMMHGLTERSPDALAVLAKSWLRPADLFLNAKGYINKGYDASQRAYILQCRDNSEKPRLRFELPGSKEHPVVNPVIIIENWGTDRPSLQIDRKDVEAGKDFRYGHRRTPQGTDLILFLKLENSKYNEITILYPEQ